MVAVGDNLAFPRIVALSKCLCAEISDCGLPELCVCTYMPGAAVAFDYVEWGSRCESGMGWARLLNAYSSVQFPAQQVAPNNCSSPLAITVEVGVVRPFTIPDNGEAPEPDVLNAATELQLADMAAIRRAVACCFSEELTMLLTYTPYGPQGGVVGGSWQVLVDCAFLPDPEL